MTAPVLVQSKLFPNSQQTGVAQVAFDANVAAGSNIYVALVSSYQNDAGVIANPFAVTATIGAGSPVSMTQVDIQRWQYEQTKAIAIFKLDNVSAGACTLNIAVAVTATDVNLTAGAFEVSGGANVAPLVVGSTISHGTSAANGTNSIVLPQLPTSGDFAGTDILMLAVESAANGTFADINWTTPTDWALALTQPDGTNGKNSFAAFSKTQSGATAINLTLLSGNNDVNGRAGILLALVDTGPAMVQKMKIVHKDSSIAGVSGVRAQFYQQPVSGRWTGDSLFAAEGLSFANEDIGGGDIRSVLYLTVPDVGTWHKSGVTLTAGDTLIAVVGIPGTGGDFVGAGGVKTAAVATVIEVAA